MHAIPNPTWEGVTSYTWADLSVHQWDCFRTALFEVVTESAAIGVAITSDSATHLIMTEQSARGVLILQTPVIMQSTTEMVTGIVVSERDYKTNMIKYLPPYERKSIVINEIIKAYDREFRNTEQSLEIANRNIFFDSAIESLPILERDLGIVTKKGLRYDQRREQVISRNIASFAQTTEEVIKSVAAAYSNGEVDVRPTDIPGVYEIKFVGVKGIPDNIEGLKQAIDIVVPAHLEFQYTYAFNAWEFLRNKTWGDVQHLSWSELQIWDGVSQ